MSFHLNDKKDPRAGNHQPTMPGTQDPNRSLDPLQKQAPQLDRNQRKKLDKLTK